ncbi:MAG: AraC family transcriptional regulator [Vulcanimicrobiaceae bacterium]
MRITGVVELTQRRNGVRSRERAEPGFATLHSRGIDAHWSWDGPGSITVIRLAAGDLRQAASAITRRDVGCVELRNSFGLRDPLLTRLVRGLLEELHAPEDGHGLTAELLSNALALHAVRRFGTEAFPTPRDAGMLTPAALRRVVDYLHDHLEGGVTLDALAAQAGFSRFAFAHAFRRTVGSSPLTYFDRLRMERARSLLTRGTHTIAAIAATLGFADHSHFSRRFHRVVGCSPTTFVRRNAPRD